MSEFGAQTCFWGLDISRLSKLVRSLVKQHRRAGVAKGLMEGFSDLLTSYENVNIGRRVRPIDAFFIYRVLLGRNPHPEDELLEIMSTPLTHREFVESIIQTEDFCKQPGLLPPNHLWLAELERFRFWFNTSDREMGVKMVLGTYETRCVDLIQRIVGPGMKCIDVGAQTGFYTCLLAALVGSQGRVYAFEPEPSNFDLLKRNIEENHYGDFTELYQSACSDASKRLQVSVVAGMCVSGEIGGAEKITVVATRADDVVDDKIDFVKIDVEGHEPFAIRGMQGIIAKNRPTILSEINEYWLRTCSGTDGKGYLNLLDSLGYDVFDVDKPDRPLEPGNLKMKILDNIEIVAFPRGKLNGLRPASLNPERQR